MMEEMECKGYLWNQCVYLPTLESSGFSPSLLANCCIQLMSSECVHKFTKDICNFHCYEKKDTIWQTLMHHLIRKIRNSVSVVHKYIHQGHKSLWCLLSPHCFFNVGHCNNIMKLNYFFINL